MANQLHTNMEGKQYVNNFGEVGIIINYINCHNVQIKSTNGYLKTVELKHLLDGSWQTPYNKTVLGVGYIGVGEYTATDKNNKITPEYRLWGGILTRVFKEEYHRKQPTYKDCTICDEWLCFQNFAEWYNNNKWDCGKEQLVVDKDIKVKGNKCYSPENCLLVTKSINSLFVKKDKNRGDLPIGVSYRNNKKNRFVASMSATIIKTDKLYKTCDTLEEAFNWYKQTKERYIKDVADLYKSKYPEFPQKLYDAMYSYKVEITD